MILYIDTTDFNRITFAIGDGRKITKRAYQVDPHKSHETLSYLQKFLKSSKISSSGLKKIVVNKGPGSYTGTRVGVTIAQALGFAWNVPIRFLPKDKFIPSMVTMEGRRK